MSLTKKIDRIKIIKDGYDQINWSFELINAKLYFPEELGDIHISEIIKAQKWLEEIMPIHAELVKVYKLLTPSMWQTYEALGGFENHRETVMLRKAKNDLRKLIVSQSRPDLFKRTKVEQWERKRAKAKTKQRKK